MLIINYQELISVAWHVLDDVIGNLLISISVVELSPRKCKFPV